MNDKTWRDDEWKGKRWMIHMKDDKMKDDTWRHEGWMMVKRDMTDSKKRHGK